jgi:hypothetical protein
MYSESMQSFADNYFNFIHKMMFHVATILAFWVGVVTYAAKGASQWYSNGGQESIAKLTMKVLHFINSKSESLYYSVEETIYTERVV